MPKGKKTHVGTIHPEKVKVRKKMPPPVRTQKSPKDYDRKRLKEKVRREIEDA